MAIVNCRSLGIPSRKNSSVKWPMTAVAVVKTSGKGTGNLRNNLQQLDISYNLNLRSQCSAFARVVGNVMVDEGFC